MRTLILTSSIQTHIQIKRKVREENKKKEYFEEYTNTNLDRKEYRINLADFSSHPDRSRSTNTLNNSFGNDDNAKSQILIKHYDTEISETPKQSSFSPKIQLKTLKKAFKKKDLKRISNKLSLKADEDSRPLTIDILGGNSSVSRSKSPAWRSKGHELQTIHTVADLHVHEKLLSSPLVKERSKRQSIMKLLQKQTAMNEGLLEENEKFAKDQASLLRLLGQKDTELKQAQVHKLKSKQVAEKFLLGVLRKYTYSKYVSK